MESIPAIILVSTAGTFLLLSVLLYFFWNGEKWMGIAACLCSFALFAGLGATVEWSYRNDIDLATCRQVVMETHPGFSVPDIKALCK